MKAIYILLIFFAFYAPELNGNVKNGLNRQNSRNPSPTQSVPLKTFSPAAISGTLTGWATWYSRESCRREGTGGRRILMANTQPLIDSHFTCALPTNITAKLNMKFGQQVRVTNLVNGRTTLLTFTDRGPGRRSRSQGTIIDITRAAFLALDGQLQSGRMSVSVEIYETHIPNNH